METGWEELKLRLKSRGWDPDVPIPGESRLEMESNPRVMIAENDPDILIPFFFRLLFNRSHIFLGNSDWGKNRWHQAIALVEPHLLIGEVSEQVRTEYEKHRESVVNCHDQEPRILLPTGGSTAGLRFAIHHWEQFELAVSGFQKHFKTEKINNCCVLPLYHAGGLMQTLRSVLTDGALAFPSWTRISEGLIPDLEPDDYFISLVPTQLRRLLQREDTVEWLKAFRTVLIGGAAASEPLLDKARSSGIKLAPSYGLTETAAMVASHLPEDFLQGRSGAGRPLPHAEITVQNESGNVVPSGSPGRIIIKTDTLSQGYYPATELPMNDGFITGDEGYFDRAGDLHILGRIDQIIITGGEKVEPVEVETAVFATGMVKDVWVTGRPDSEWGQRVTAVYVPNDAEVTPEILKKSLGDKLSPFQIPKLWIPLKNIPRNPAGKIERDQIDFF
jgi:O-succinylbenzoic acid--CoA ligase